MIEEAEKLVKVLAEFLNENGTTSMEGLRAASLGNNLYELRNIPIFGSGLHLFDIVQCREYFDEDHCPVVLKVVKPSGFETIGIVFANEAGAEEQADIMMVLYNQHHNLHYERISKQHVAIAFPQSEYEAICEMLDSHLSLHISLYEKLD